MWLLTVRSSCPPMDLSSTIAEAVVAMDLFFNNRFAESKVIYQKWYKQFDDFMSVVMLW